jgi:hypothetical protein
VYPTYGEAKIALKGDSKNCKGMKKPAFSGLTNYLKRFDGG